MQAASTMIYISLAIFASLGAFVAALIHKSGYSFILKCEKEETPKFLIRFFVQFAYLAIAAVLGYLYFDYISSKSLQDFANEANAGPSFFTTNPFIATALYAVLSIAAYGLLCSFLLMIFTKFDFVDSLKSLSILLFLITAIYTALLIHANNLGYFGNAQQNNLTVKGEYKFEMNIPQGMVEQSTNEKFISDGEWGFNQKKSFDVCNSTNDATAKSSCIQTINEITEKFGKSMKLSVSNNVIFDGSKTCNLQKIINSQNAFECIEGDGTTTNVIVLDKNNMTMDAGVAVIAFSKN
jgi:hypothetical protein